MTAATAAAAVGMGRWVCRVVGRSGFGIGTSRVPPDDHLAGKDLSIHINCEERIEGDLNSAPRPVEEVVGVGGDAIAAQRSSGVGERTLRVDVDEQPRRYVRDSTGCGS
ncbi:hypothetical protein QTP88_022745 [Uroleucon formosanum]